MFHTEYTKDFAENSKEIFNNSTFVVFVKFHCDLCEK